MEEDQPAVNEDHVQSNDQIMTDASDQEMGVIDPNSVEDTSEDAEARSTSSATPVTPVTPATPATPATPVAAPATSSTTTTIDSPMVPDTPATPATPSAVTSTPTASATIEARDAETPQAMAPTPTQPTSTPLAPPAESSAPDTPKEHVPFMNTPASWQIPPAALQAKAERPEVKQSTKRERLEQEVEQSPNDMDAWSKLIAEVQKLGDLDIARDVFERFLALYPLSPRQWLSYLELELFHSNFKEVEAIFSRCLQSVLSVDIFKTYLGYMRRINLGENGMASTPEARTIIEKAYEYVLSNVGIDKDAGPIWTDYITFLKLAEASGTWQEQRKMDSMRSAYQRAVTIPLRNLEQIWEEYNQWENGLSRLTAKKFLGERSPAYMTARTSLREMQQFTDKLTRPAMAKPPQWVKKDIQQLVLWKQYIEWEKNNPLQLDKEEDVAKRVAFVYQQAVFALMFYPEIWFEFANYYQEQGKTDKALATLKQGMGVLPTSLLLHFAYAEISEAQKQMSDAKEAFDSLLKALSNEITKIETAASEDKEKIERRAKSEMTEMKNNVKEDDLDLDEHLREREQKMKSDLADVDEQAKEKTDIIARSNSLVWISYMRAIRRSEGIGAARQLFAKAYKSPHLTYHVFIASALMEYHNTKDPKVADRVFVLGNKSFSDDPGFVSEYLDYLFQRNDDNNARAVFERTLATMPPDKAGPIWYKFLDYENKYGDLSNVLSVEKRRMEAMKELSPLDQFLERSSYLDVNIVEEQEMGGEVRREIEEDETDTNVEAMKHAARNRSAPIRERGKGLLLDSVNPELYKKPDLDNHWKSFKPSAEPQRAPIAAFEPIADLVPAVASPMAPAVPPSPPVPMSAPLLPQQQQQLQQQQQQQQQLPSALPPPPSQAPPTMPPGPAWLQYLTSILPPPHTFDGPAIHVDELIFLLRDCHLPGMPPPMPHHPMQPSHPSSGSPLRPKGRRKAKSGKPPKRPRDEFEDEFGRHKGKRRGYIP